jgi:hypothetical protein
MFFPATSVVDNRQAEEEYDILKARVEALKNRITEVEEENEMLRSKLLPERGTISRLLRSRPDSY